MIELNAKQVSNNGVVLGRTQMVEMRIPYNLVLNLCLCILHHSTHTLSADFGLSVLTARFAQKFSTAHICIGIESHQNNTAGLSVIQ